MLAYVHQNKGYSLVDMPKPEIGEYEVLVKIKYASLNRRDLYIRNRRGDHPKKLILGSDGAGIIYETGANVTRFKEGEEVLINPSLNWFEQSIASPSEFDILGMPDDGTFATYIAINEEQLERKPAYLCFAEASTIALAGMTGYRALITKGQLQSGETVFIPGASSGVSTFMIQIAKAKGARVIVTSRCSKKREQALKIGADLALDTSEDWHGQLKAETIDLVIDSVGGETFNRALKVVKKGGRVVIFGATTDDVISFNLREFFYGQYELLGSTMASREELRELLEFMEKNKIKPIIDTVYPLDKADEAFKSLEENKQFGKIILEI